MSNPSSPDQRDQWHQRDARIPTAGRGRHASLSVTVPQAMATEVAPPPTTPPPVRPVRSVPPVRQAMTRVTGALPRLTESPVAGAWKRLPTRTRIIAAAVGAAVVVVAAVFAFTMSSSPATPPGGSQAAGINEVTGTGPGGTSGAAGSTTGHGGGANAGNTNGGKLPAPSVTLSANGGPNIPKPIYPTNAKTAKAWYSGSGGKALKRVNNQAGSALMAHGASQYKEMRAACDTLTGAVSTAKAAPPIPDTAMQQMYAKALTAFNNGAAGCLTAITQHQEGVEDTVTHVDSAAMKTVVTKLNTGMTDLYVATEALRAPAGTK